jgi:4-aminobutyrate aminotransferase-like enzyme
MTTAKDSQTGSQQDLIRRRAQLLGPDLSLSYENPLHLVRGEDVWLYDADGQAYLDAYNNVAHVGHCHADVVAAITRQAALLNTNTRYLHETVLDLSENLTAKLPPDLDVCFFVNSGSEANDIAWQMAKACTGNTGILVLDEAYHGISEATFAMSPSEYDAANQPDHVETLESPDSYRGRLRGNSPEVGIGYTENCDQAIAALAQRGHAPAALIIDSGTSSSGILDLPEGYLPAVVEKVRTAGGLYIADEVQVGLGRSGSHFWGFEAFGVKPDIVTIGKPIGNGHPIGIVVTSREILAKFNACVPFFSTFGGNPVSAAAGLEVLKIIDRQNLLQNAQETSAYLKQGIKDLAERELLIGDVRGSGLLIGIDLVLDRETREPAGKAANLIFNYMRNNGVLIGTSGPHGNVLKIRPPMTFSKAHADQLISTLADALNTRLE